MSGGLEQVRRWAHENLIYRTVVLARGEGAVFSHLRDLERWQHDSPERLHDRQAARLSELIGYATTRSPHYRRTLGASLRPTPSESTALLKTLPLVSKHDLQDHLRDLQAHPLPGRVTRKTTGGSTGQAVTLLKDRAALAHEMAATWLAYGWFGVRIGDPSARFWGSAQTASRRFRAAAVRFAVRRVNFSAFAFDEHDLDRYWEGCRRFRPAFLYGYVSMLEAFAAHLQRRGIDGRALRVKSVITTSEVLGAPQRRLLSDVFGAPVQNEYGCGEVGPIAYECERGGLHTMAENLLVELLDPAGRPVPRGVDGEVVVTDLNNRATPLIRYRVGDNAVWGAPCACGRAWPVFERVWGRAYDFVEGPDGRRYHGEYFMYIFEDLREAVGGVRQFQVTQGAPAALDVAIVAESLDSGVTNRLQSLFAARLPGFAVTFRAVSAIARTSSGKLRLIQNTMRVADAP